MKTIVLIVLGLCLLLCISAEKSSHKHAEKLLKNGHELEVSKREVDIGAAAKSPLPAPEETPAVKPAVSREAGRKHHRHGKNKKGSSASHHQQEQQQQQQQPQQQQHEKQNGRSRKSHSKPKVNNNNNNGPSKAHSKHGRKHGRGKQPQ